MFAYAHFLKLLEEFDVLEKVCNISEEGRKWLKNSTCFFSELNKKTIQCLLRKGVLKILEK